MKVLFFTLFLLSAAFAEDPAPAVKDPNCEQPTPSSEAESLAVQAKAAAAKTSFSQDYCEAYNACMGLSSDSGCTYAEGSYKSALNQSGGGSCGLTAEELSAIKFYTGSGYGCLNSFLRNPEGKNPKIEILVKVLDQGLGRLPRYRGFVSRGSGLPEKVRELHKEGAEVEYAAYTSTSSGKGFDGTDQFLIYSERGRPIMNFSGYKSENEVLFASRTRFRVISLKAGSSNNSYDSPNRYIMREVIGTEDDKKKLAEDARVIALAQKQLKDPVKTPPPPPKPKPNWVYSPYPSSMYLTLDANGEKTIHTKSYTGADVISGKYFPDKTFQKYFNGQPDGKPVPLPDNKDPLEMGYPICGPEAAAYVAAQKGEDPSKPKLKCFSNASNFIGMGGGDVGGSMGGSESSSPTDSNPPKPKAKWVSQPGSGQMYILIDEKGEKVMYSQNQLNLPPVMTAKFLPDGNYQTYQNGNPVGGPVKLQGYDPMDGSTPICGPGAEKFVAENGGAQENPNLECFTNANFYQSTYTPSTPADTWKCPSDDEKFPEVIEQTNLPNDTAKFFPQEEAKP